MASYNVAVWVVSSAGLDDIYLSLLPIHTIITHVQQDFHEGEHIPWLKRLILVLVSLRPTIDCPYDQTPCTLERACLVRATWKQTTAFASLPALVKPQ
jgi:hypothetical protein